ncbi:ABC transporter permease [Pseudahrensia aquimaris]|uniref:ABC transporter permease n=1 Tax=Pseudahrensia aquimaris TaxID=744461 RepID=A0ABW3FJY8_9HYPH
MSASQTTISSGERKHDARNDVFRAAAMWRLALANAFMELDQRYRRTFIGKWWIALTFLLFVGVKVVIFGALNNVSLQFFAPYLAMGYMLFRFISQSVTGGAAVFISSQSWIKTEPLPISIHLFSFLAKNFIMMFFMAIPALILCFWAGRYSWVALGSLPFVVVLYAINHLWVSCLLGIIAARFRDVVYVLVTVMQVLYFATPILWVPTETGIRAWAAALNPLTHYIAVLRDPMMYGTVPWISWAVVMSMTIIGCILAAIAFVRYRKKLVYWI